MEVGGTVAYPAAQDDNSTAGCLEVPRFAVRAILRGYESHEIRICLIIHRVLTPHR